MATETEPIEVDTAIKNLNSIWNDYRHDTEAQIKALQKIDGKWEKEKELLLERIQEFEDADTDSEIVCVSGSIEYKVNGNLWLEQIMQNVEKIIQNKGEKYLLDLLDREL